MLFSHFLCVFSLLRVSVAYVQPFLDISGFSWAENLLITNDGKNMFVSEYTRGELYRIYLSTDRTTYLKSVHLSNSSFSNFAGLAQTTDGLKIYAGVVFKDASVGIISTQASSSNNGAYTVIKKTSKQPNGLAFDATGNKLYYTEVTSNTLYSVDTVTFAEAVVATVSGANGLWLDAERLLYVGELTNKYVNVFDLKKSPPTKLGRYPGFSALKGVHALDDLTVYKKNSANPALTVALGADFSGKKIQKFTLDGSSVEQVVVSETVLAGGEVQSTTSVRWGKLPDFDPDSVYVTEGGGLTADTKNRRVFQVKLFPEVPNSCIGCPEDICALVPPQADALSDLCYEGNNADAQVCFETDPLLQDGTTARCGACPTFGFPSYFRNDPLYPNMKLYQIDATSTSFTTSQDSCIGCAGNQCALVPPTADGPEDLCYQGTNSDAEFVLKHDPLLAEGTVPRCGVCADYGFPSYFRNDPIFTCMALYQIASRRLTTTSSSSVSSSSSSVSSSSSSSSSVSSSSITSCSACGGDQCTILPPNADEPTDLCYQGNNADTQQCFETDPLLQDGAYLACGVCTDFGFSTFLTNDPLYPTMQLWQTPQPAPTSGDPCLGCPDNTCALVPPQPYTATSLCYQGNNQNAQFCYLTDPLIVEGTVPVCEVCKDFGFTYYFRNDPIYTNMELWQVPTTTSTTGGVSSCLQCPDNTCALVLPSATSQKDLCYQSGNEDAEVFYDTNPLLPEGIVRYCGTCAAYGFPVFMRSDPLYPDTSLYQMDSATAASYSESSSSGNDDGAKMAVIYSLIAISFTSILVTVGALVYFTSLRKPKATSSSQDSHSSSLTTNLF